MAGPHSSVHRIAAIQLEPAVGDVAENLTRCRALVDEAGMAGARWIVLPELFTTGMAFSDALADAALPADGAGMQLLRELAQRHAAVVCGSFVCRDEDGENATHGSCSAPTGASSAATTRTCRHPRGVVPAAAWAYQRAHGRRWHRRHAVGRHAVGRHAVGRHAVGRSLQEMTRRPVPLPDSNSSS